MRTCDTIRAVVEKWEHTHTLQFRTPACTLATYILIGSYQPYLNRWPDQWCLNMWSIGKTHPGGNFQFPEPLHDELPRECAPVDEGGAVRVSVSQEWRRGARVRGVWGVRNVWKAWVVCYCYGLIFY